MKKLFAELKAYKIESIAAPLLKLSEAVLELIVPLIVANTLPEITILLGSLFYCFSLAL